MSKSTFLFFLFLGFSYTSFSQAYLLEKYDDISLFHNGKAMAELDGKWGLVDIEGDPITEFLYDYIDYEDDYDSIAFYSYGISDKYGLLNENGEAITPPIYDEYGFFFWHKYEDAKLIQVTSNELVGFINYSGEVIIDCICNDVYLDFDDGTIECSINSKESLYSLTGEVLVPDDFEDITMINDSLFEVKLYDQAGIYKAGKGIIIPLSNSEFSWQGNLIIEQSENTANLYSFEGELISNGVYNSLKFGHRIIITSQGDNKGILDENGSKYSDPTYNDIDLIYGRGDLKYYILDSDTSQAFLLFSKDDFKIHSFPSDWEQIDYLQNGLFQLIKGSDHFLYSIHSQKKSLVSYVVEGYFSSNRAPIYLVGLDGIERGGYIDSLGQIVVEPKFVKVEEFYSGVAIVTNNYDNRIIIDKIGNSITDLVFDEVHTFNHGLGIVSSDGQYGILGSDGTLLVPTVFDYIDLEDEDDIPNASPIYYFSNSSENYSGELFLDHEDGSYSLTIYDSNEDEIYSCYCSEENINKNDIKQLVKYLKIDKKNYSKLF